LSRGKPLMGQAKKLAKINGTTVEEEYRKIQLERQTARRKDYLKNAPKAVQLNDGTYERVSMDYRYPYGIDDLGDPIFPYGKTGAGHPILNHEDRKTSRPAMGQRRADGPYVQKVGSKVAKTRLNETILEKLTRLGCDPIVGMAEIAMDKQNSVDTRLRAFSELASYAYPKQRSVEFKGDGPKQQVFVVAIPQQERAKTAEEWAKDITPTINGVAKPQEDVN
jgi:hypothetical protein